LVTDLDDRSAAREAIGSRSASRFDLLDARLAEDLSVALGRRAAFRDARVEDLSLHVVVVLLLVELKAEMKHFFGVSVRLDLGSKSELSVRLGRLVGIWLATGEDNEQRRDDRG
jgi:hypothetical protein